MELFEAQIAVMPMTGSGGDFLYADDAAALAGGDAASDADALTAQMVRRVAAAHEERGDARPASMPTLSELFFDPQHQEAEGEDIIVTGKRGRDAGDEDSGGAGVIRIGGGGSRGGGGGGRAGGFDPPTPTPDCQQTDFENRTGGELSGTDELAKSETKEAIGTILNGLKDAAEDTRVSVGSIGFSMRELFTLISKADFVLMPANTPYDNNPSADVRGTGMADRNNGNPVLTVNIDSLRGYVFGNGSSNITYAKDSAVFYVLHEVIHTTQEFWAARSRSTAYEQLTDAAVFAVAKELGIDLGNFVPYLGPPPQSGQVTPGSGQPAGSQPVCGR